MYVYDVDIRLPVEGDVSPHETPPRCVPRLLNASGTGNSVPPTRPPCDDWLQTIGTLTARASDSQEHAFYPHSVVDAVLLHVSTKPELLAHTNCRAVLGTSPMDNASTAFHAWGPTGTLSNDRLCSRSLHSVNGPCCCPFACMYPDAGRVVNYRGYHGSEQPPCARWGRAL